MDKTEQYIKMCERATEIQEAWKPQSGDFVHSNVKEEVRILYFSKHHGSPPEVYLNTHFTHWLPRQDQLQEMITTSFLPDWILNYGLMPRHKRNHLYDSKTFEQAWLREVMFSKFNKVWNGKDWVLND